VVFYPRGIEGRNLKENFYMAGKVYRAFALFFIWTVLALAQQSSTIACLQTFAQGRVLWQFNTGG
jgi:hypothetical protein